ncbi:MYND finger domain-containing protein [Phthorimaea operculella]|nr:MYND finger domain-containing protein [Phthorimaea operculella]
MSEDSFVEQLAGFDFSTPVEVNIIFEEEEEEFSTADIDINQENTSDEENKTDDNSNKIITSHDETYIKTENDLSPITKKNEESEKINVNDSKKVINEPLSNTKCNYYEVKEEKKYLDDDIPKGLEICNESSTEPFPNDRATVPTNDVVKNPNINVNTKRKLEEDTNYESNKYSRVSENKSSRNDYEFPGEGMSAPQPKTMDTKDNALNAAEDTENSENNTEMTCITKLLQSVSKHLILIIDAYVKYAAFKDKKPKNCPETVKAWNNFLRIKYHFFNLSFCTVDSIILPQKDNVFFTGKFLNDTVKLAASKKFMLCLETQVAPVFLELLEWTKQKKISLNSMPIETESNVVTSARTPQNFPLLNQQLRSPPKQFTNTGPMVQPVANTGPMVQPVANTGPMVQPMEKGWNACVNTSQQNVVNEMNRFVNNYHHEMSARPNIAANEGHSSVEDMNRHSQLPQYGSQNNQHQSKESSLYRLLNGRVEYNTTSMPAPQRNQSLNYNAGCLPKSNLSQMQSNRSVQDPNLSPNKAKYMPHNRTENPLTIEIFSKGPPGRQQGQPSSQQSLGSNSYVQNNVPQTSYQISGNAPWQQGTSGYIGSIDPKPMVPPQPVIQPDHQVLEMARSGSTDSGFMSPLNFNSSSETTKDGTDDTSMLPSPIITHVTSLNPGVQYLKEGFCYVCGSKTRKMCNGCYRKYYCSLECQRTDWDVHRTTCDSATTR